MTVSVDTPISEVPFVVFDTETTGLSPDADGVIEIAGIRISGGIVQENDHFHSLVNPVRPIPYDAQQVHGITDEAVSNAQMFEVVLPQFLGFVDDAVLVAHNADFDIRFLNKTLESMGWGAWDKPVVCTMLLSRMLFSGERRHDLGSVATRLELPPQERHRALGDALQTARVFARFCNTLAADGRTTFSALEAALL